MGQGHAPSTTAEDLSTAEDFGRFLSAQRPRLEAVARRVVNDGPMAEDVVSDAALRVWRRMSVEVPDNPAGYLTTAVRNEAITQLRRVKRERDVVAVLAPPAAPSEEARVDDRDYVQRLLSTLTPAQRATLEMRYGMDCSETEIAEALGVPAGTVKSHAHRALRRLRDEVTAA